MGLLVDGKWHDSWYKNKNADGRFIRSESQFRNTLTKDGRNGFKAKSGRYHLYISLACPWASRVLMMLKLKGLEDIIGLSVVSPLMFENGWSFEDYEGVIPDPVINAKYLYEIYTVSDAKYSGRVTVPVLFDKHSKKIVNNESSEIMRIFNTCFDNIGANSYDFYPENLQSEIDEINSYVYEYINNGVYKTGFATKQEVYEQEVKNLFKALDKIENLLEGKSFLVKDRFTEADIRLFTTLVRFDAVYFGNFKCNIRELKDYKNLWAYTKRIYNIDGISSTVNMDHIKTHYYKSHPSINPNGIVPLGPEIDFSI